jgi:xylulokinase
MWRNNPLYLAGIDLGTTGCKGMVVDAEGNIAGSHYKEYDLIFTKEGVEQDANLWWEYSKAVLKEAVKQSGINGEALAGISFSSQGIAFVPVDRECRPLANAVSWYDTRAQAEAKEMAADYGEQYLFDTTGRPPFSLFFPQVLYLKRHNQELYKKTWKFLLAQDYLCCRFCGNAFTDYTMASGTLCFDTGTHQWIQEFFDRYGVDKDKFPKLKGFGEKAGFILKEVAAELGISEKAVIAVGLQDQKAAALGAGITLGKGITTVSIGTATAVCVLSQRICDPSRRVLCHAFDGKNYILENHIGTSGASLKWLRTALFSDMDYSVLDEIAGNAKPGAGGVIFYPGMDSKNGSFTGLSLNSNRGEIIRALLEGIAYGVRRCVEIQREVSPAAADTQEIRAFGSGAKSPLWLQILADCIGLPIVQLRTQDTANLGAAVCAGLALGLFSERAALNRFIGSPQKVFAPNQGVSELYNEGYRKYLALSEALRSMST